MLKIILSILSIFLTINSFSQEIDVEKVEKISSVLCDCLNFNTEKEDDVRINECSKVLVEGLSVIKDEKVRIAYAQKSDTFLQRNCLEYALLIFRNAPISDVKLVNKNVYENYAKQSITGITGEYSYTDFFGKTFKVEITKSFWSEKIMNTKFQIDFELNKTKSSLTFKESNHSFFSDFYYKNEEIEVKYKFASDVSLNIIFNLGNDIYLKKVLTKL